jgi:hypothetical protein
MFKDGLLQTVGKAQPMNWQGSELEDYGLVHPNLLVYPVMGPTLRNMNLNDYQ